MANGNQSGFGTPGTQQTAQQNVKAGGVNPNMPAGQQLAKQGASSYQQSLTTGGASPGVNLAKAAYTAAPPPVAKPSPLAGFPYKESLGMNASLGFSNEAPATMPEYTPGGGDLESTFMALSGLPATEGPGKWVWDENLQQRVREDRETSPAMEEVEEEWQQTYPGDATPDEVGFAEEDKQKIFDDMQENAEFTYQQAVSGLSRQYAMMGMTGSGSHIAANNALAAEIANQLNNEYAALAAADLKQIEVDIQERVDNLHKKLALGEQIKANDLQSLANFLGIADSTIIQTALSIFDEQGVTPPPGFTALLIEGITDYATNGDQTLLNQALAMAEQSSGLVAGGTTADSEINILFTQYSSNNPHGTKFTLEDIEDFAQKNGILPSDFWDSVKGKALAMGLGHDDVVAMFGGTWGSSYGKGGSESLEDQGMSN